MSCDTDGESFPSKYQQIRWIVSLQLISPVPSEDELKFEFFPGSMHFPGQNVMENPDYNCLKMKEKRTKPETVACAYTANFTGVRLGRECWLTPVAVTRAW